MAKNPVSIMLRKPTPKPKPMMAGSTDVSNSPAGRASRAVNKWMAGSSLVPKYPAVKRLTEDPNKALKAKLAAAVAAAAVQAQDAKPGVRPSPIPTLTPPGTKAVRVGAGDQLVNVAGIRSFLISKGYDLPKSKDPKVGVALAAAINNWGLHNIPTKFAPTSALVTLMQNKGWKADGYSGSKDIKTFNSGAGVTSKVGRGAAANYTPGGNAKSNPTSSYDPSKMDAAVQGANSVPMNENAPATNLYDANALSRALAGNEWDNTINDAQNNVGKNTAQGKQNLHDIGSWFDQMLGAARTATTRDTAITKAGQDSVAAADQAIIGSLGGSASAGASTVGAQAAADQGTLAALGASQDQYNQDLAPIMQGERAGQLSAETARGSSRAADLAQLLAAAKTSKAGSTAQHLLDLTELNNNRRDAADARNFQYKQFNAQQTQQGVSNANAADSLRIAAFAAGQRAVAGASKPTKGSYGDTSAMSKNALAQSIYDALKANPGMTAQQGMNLVKAHAVQQGWNMADPQVSGWAQSVWNNSGYQPQGG